MTAECFRCGAPADRQFGNSFICEDCIPDGSVSESETNLSEDRHTPPVAGDSWSAADFSASKGGVWPPELLKRVQWMGHVEKKPFAPWANRNHPDADAEEDARWKWGLEENYADGETVAMAEVDPRLDGRAFLQQEADPYAYVDGDDVRDPETGEVHPAFVEILTRLGLTYADISQSGAGVHAQYRGELPDGVKQAAWDLDDEPFGENDDLPSVEIYAGKRVCVATGQHVPGTPVEIREWDDDGLEALLDENEQLPEMARENVPTARERYDLVNHTPTARTAEEDTDDIRDLFIALDRLDARDVAELTIVHAWNDDASTSDGKRAFTPTWGPNANGTANIVDDRIWQDTGGGGYGGPVVMALIDLGELRPGTASPRQANGAAWFTGIDHLRDLGFSIPEYNPENDGTADHVALLPPAVRDVWDWREASVGQESLTIDAARERCQDVLEAALRGRGEILVEALPTLGKSSGTVRAAAATGEPVTILTGRGRKEQYEQLREWCHELGLEAYTLPAFTHDCPTANGEHDRDWRERVMDWYRRGATPQDIHKYAEAELGRALPCQAGEHTCPYGAKWDFDPRDYDVLIGHYAHAHKQKVTSGRTVAVDEFPAGAYETTLDHRLPGAVTRFLQHVDALPFDDYTDLIEHRHDEQRRADALAWFDEEDLRLDSEQAIADAHGHAAAPLATFTILAGAKADLGNGWERASLDDGVGLFDREQGVVTLLTPPEFQYSRGVVGLDGTPTRRMWELSLGLSLTHRQVLSPKERREYLQDALGLQLVQTTEWIKPYNNADHVNLGEDAALLERIQEVHGERPALISSATALGEYRSAELLDDLVDDYAHYGNVLGSNEFKHTRVGAVIGSTHYGDRYIEKWGAYAGEAISRNDGKGADLSYGHFGDQILTHMREHEVLQAAMRFGRDGNGATVYVHTAALPEWVPRAGEGRVLSTWSAGMKQVLEAASGRDEWTTAELAAAPGVEISERQVRSHLTTLFGDDTLSRESVGCGFVWRDDGLHRLGEHGDVELEAVDVDDLTDKESAEVARSSYYTWDFRTSGAVEGGTTAGADVAGVSPDGHPADGGDRPPDDPV